MRSLSFFSKMVLLHSGFSMMFGSVFLGTGLFFSYLFVPLALIGDGMKPALAVVLFPIVGAFFVGSAYRDNFKTLDMLQSGVIAKGRIQHRTQTTSYVKINNHKYPVYKYDILFMDKQGEVRACSDQSHRDDLLHDENAVAVLYPADEPTEGVLYNVIPNAPALLADGSLGELPLSSATALILPFGFLAAHAYIWLRLLYPLAWTFLKHL